MKTQECTMGTVYDGMAENYIGRLRPADREYLDRSELQELFRLPVDNETVLDVGCGVGRVGIALMDRGVAYIGVDLSEAMLQAGASWLAIHNCSFVRRRVVYRSRLEDFGSLPVLACTNTWKTLQLI